VKGRIDVVKELVACFDGYACGFGDERPAVELVVDIANGLVVAIEGGEGTEHGPAGTEGLGRVECVATNISTNLRELDVCRRLGMRKIWEDGLGIDDQTPSSKP
jgi:hypothetical protein